MRMAEIKTKPNAASVEKFLNSVKDTRQREDSFTLLEMMKKASKEEPQMWGAALIGFGNVTVKSPNSGREVDWLRIGFSPRKANISVYISGDIQTQHGPALKKLGKHKTGKGCLYINKLEDVDLKVLKGMIDASLKRKDFFEK
jgi:hypothetical protein